METDTWVDPEVQQLLNDLKEFQKWCQCAKCKNYFGFGCPCCTGCIQLTFTGPQYVYKCPRDLERALERREAPFADIKGLGVKRVGGQYYIVLNEPIMAIAEDERFIRQVYDKSFYIQDFEFDKMMVERARQSKQAGQPSTEHWAWTKYSMCTIL